MAEFGRGPNSENMKHGRCPLQLLYMAEAILTMFFFENAPHRTQLLSHVSSSSYDTHAPYRTGLLSPHPVDVDLDSPVTQPELNYNSPPSKTKRKIILR